MKAPAFELAFSPYGTVSVNFTEEVPELLRLEMVDVLQPFLGLGGRSTDEILYAIRSQLEGWLRDRIHTGELYFDHIYKTWRFRL